MSNMEEEMYQYNEEETRDLYNDLNVVVSDDEDEGQQNSSLKYTAEQLMTIKDESINVRMNVTESEYALQFHAEEQYEAVMCILCGGDKMYDLQQYKRHLKKAHPQQFVQSHPTFQYCKYCQTPIQMTNKAHFIICQNKHLKQRSYILHNKIVEVQKQQNLIIQNLCAKFVQKDSTLHEFKQKLAESYRVKQATFSQKNKSSISKTKSLNLSLINQSKRRQQEEEEENNSLERQMAQMCTTTIQSEIQDESQPKLIKVIPQQTEVVFVEIFPVQEIQVEETQPVVEEKQLEQKSIKISRQKLLPQACEEDIPTHQHNQTEDEPVKKKRTKKQPE